MSRIDFATKVFFNQNDIFASLVNNFVLQGGKVAPDSLEDWPTEHIVEMPPEGEVSGKGRPRLLKRERDLLKKACIKTHAGLTYVMMGLEIQSYPNYIMPLRVLGYDVMLLMMLVKDIVSTNRRNHLLNREDPAEFLSGFRKTDKVPPVVTTVVNLGDSPWSGPMKLSQMYDFPKGMEYLQRLCPDYKLNVISLGDISKFKTKKLDYRVDFISKCINLRNDKNKIKAFWEKSVNDPEITAETWGLAYELLSPHGKLKKEEAMSCNPEVYPFVMSYFKEKFYRQGEAGGIAKGMEQGMVKIITEAGTSFRRKGMSLEEAVRQICGMIPSVSQQKAMEILTPVF